MRRMLRCPKCFNYTFKEACPRCGTKTTLPKPPKWSPEDRYGKWRREARKELLKQKGLL